MKFPIKSIRSLEEFKSYISFIENKVKVLNEVKSMITARIRLDKQYSKDIIADTTVSSFSRKNILDGFIIEKVIKIELKRIYV
jgi:hypothetical protein